MSLTPRISNKTRQNWWLDSLLLMSGVLASLSGVYFLFFVSGGYQGGRNPSYGLTFLFSRHTWDMWHTWTGVGMVLIALLHVIVHWNWLINALRRSVRTLVKGPKLNPQTWVNILVNALIGASSLVTAVSGIFFLFFPGGKGAVDGFVLNRTTWDLLHTWGGVLFVLAAVAHFIIHWRWIKNVTRKVFMVLVKRSEAERAEELCPVK